MHVFKRCSTVQKDQWAEMQNDMKSPAVTFWCPLANFVSGSEGMPLMLLNLTIVSLSENEFRLHSTFWQIIHLFPFEVRFWVNVIQFYFQVLLQMHLQERHEVPCHKASHTSDPPLFSVTYFNHHTCSNSSNPMGSTRDIAAQSSSRKAVSICFSPHTASEQPAFLTSSATPQSPNIHSFRVNQQPERSPHASQFQWTTASSPTSNGPLTMEVDSVSGASISSSSRGALPRTLLPIGQSRCIEYFHFLWCCSWKKKVIYAGRPLGASLERQVLGGNIVIPGLNHRDPTYR